MRALQWLLPAHSQGDHVSLNYRNNIQRIYFNCYRLRQHLYGKNDGGDEKGLGLTSDPSGDLEIVNGQFIQLDVSAWGPLQSRLS